MERTGLKAAITHKSANACLARCQTRLLRVAEKIRKRDERRCFYKSPTLDARWPVQWQQAHCPPEAVLSLVWRSLFGMRATGRVEASRVVKHRLVSSGIYFLRALRVKS